LNAQASPVRDSQPTRLSFIAWARTPGRSAEIAAALDGNARCMFPLGTLPKSSVTTLARYAVSAVMTMAHLSWRRPDAVIVQNPPVVPGLLALTYCRARAVPFVLDSHPVAFGAKNRGLYARLSGVHKWMARRSNAVFVASEPFADIVNEWGGNGVVVHEAPTSWPHVATSANKRPTVFFVCTFSTDEPYGAVIEAARQMPDVDVVVTGDTARAEADVIASAPPNVRFTGFLDQQAYREQLQGADVVMSLTTEPSSVMRSAYEAVYAKRPLIVTDWPNLRRVFPYASFCANDAPSIAVAVKEALSNGSDAVALDRAFSEQSQRWDAQLQSMRDALRTRR
jgi:hypothetical protein